MIKSSTMVVAEEPVVVIRVFAAILNIMVALTIAYFLLSLCILVINPKRVIVPEHVHLNQKKYIVYCERYLKDSIGTERLKEIYYNEK